MEARGTPHKDGRWLQGSGGCKLTLKRSTRESNPDQMPWREFRNSARWSLPRPCEDNPLELEPILVSGYCPS